jgi:hypothetical protein
MKQPRQSVEQMIGKLSSAGAEPDHWADSYVMPLRLRCGLSGKCHAADYFDALPNSAHTSSRSPLTYSRVFTIAG